MAWSIARVMFNREIPKIKPSLPLLILLTEKKNRKKKQNTHTHTYIQPCIAAGAFEQRDDGHHNVRHVVWDWIASHCKPMYCARCYCKAGFGACSWGDSAYINTQTPHSNASNQMSCLEQQTSITYRCINEVVHTSNNYLITRAPAVSIYAW